MCARRVRVYSHKGLVSTTLGTLSHPPLPGFDACGKVKLFDFGLARELSLSDRDENGMYLLTAETGYPRCMDPIIVGYGKFIAEKSDTMSWSMFIHFAYFCGRFLPWRHLMHATKPMPVFRRKFSAGVGVQSATKYGLHHFAL